MTTCPKCNSWGAQDPSGAYWCQTCDHVWFPRIEYIGASGQMVVQDPYPESRLGPYGESVAA